MEELIGSNGRVKADLSESSEKPTRSLSDSEWIGIHHFSRLKEQILKIQEGLLVVFHVNL